MKHQSDVYKIVFLIDVGIGESNDEEQSLFYKTVRRVQVSALKLLTYFANKVPESCRTKNVLWGYKFYNFAALNLSIEKHGFKEFSLRPFEEFENELESRLELEKATRQGLGMRQGGNEKRSQNSDKADDGKGNAADMKDQDAANVKLKKKLTELLGDFQWDLPDIGSPVRPVRPTRKSRVSYPQANEPKHHHFVFMFSGCWQTTPALVQFADCMDKVDLTCDDLLDSFMPNVLYRQFYERSRIRLFMVDVNADPLVRNPNEGVDGIELMHKALKRVDGGVIPVNALLQLGTPSNTFLTPLLHSDAEGSCDRSTNIPTQNNSNDIIKHTDIETNQCTSEQNIDSQSVNRPHVNRTVEKDKFCDILLPFSTVFEFYQRKFHSVENQSTATGFLAVEEGGLRKLLCHIKLEHMHIGQTEETQGHNPVIGTSTAPLPLSVHIPQKPGTTSIRHHRQDNQCSIPISMSYAGSSDQDPSSVVQQTLLQLLVVHGVMGCSQVPLHALQSDVVYMVLEAAPNNNKMALIKFPTLLTYLAEHRLAVVVECADSATRLPRMGILQPLTAVSATLTFVKSDMTLLVEKLLHFKVNPPDIYGKETDEMRTFIKQNIPEIRRQSPKKKKVPTATLR